MDQGKVCNILELIFFLTAGIGYMIIAILPLLAGGWYLITVTAGLAAFLCFLNLREAWISLMAMEEIN